MVYFDWRVTITSIMWYDCKQLKHTINEITIN
jgi:hypothetical protein